MSKDECERWGLGGEGKEADSMYTFRRDRGLVEGLEDAFAVGCISRCCFSLSGTSRRARRPVLMTLLVMVASLPS